MSGYWQYPTYLVKKKILQAFGATFNILGPDGAMVFYSKLKAFKLKEDIRLYTGEDMKTEVLTIQARQILDVSATYDVVDPTVNKKVGAWRRKGMRSILRDEWQLLDENDREIGLLQEDSMALALIRRFLINLIPQKFTLVMNGQEVMHLKQNFNPLTIRMAVDFTPDTGNLLDRRLGLAGAVLISAIEGRQN